MFGKTKPKNHSKMKNYYSEKLNAARLRKCYEIASPRVKQYLTAEINFAMEFINPENHVLELGCGYGRVIQQIQKKTKNVVGIDISKENIEFAKNYLGEKSPGLSVMNAAQTGFRDNLFDIVVCIQNGISAFKVEPFHLVKEALRITRKGGILLFSSYSERFWEERLIWFRDQATHKLLGEIDEQATGKGIIVCRDGFRAITFSEKDFLKLASKLNVSVKIQEVDESSLFCILEVK